MIGKLKSENAHTHQCRRKACRNADSPSITIRTDTLSNTKQQKITVSISDEPDCRATRISMCHNTSDNTIHVNRT